MATKDTTIINDKRVRCSVSTSDSVPHYDLSQGQLLQHSGMPSRLRGERVRGGANFTGTLVSQSADLNANRQERP